MTKTFLLHAAMIGLTALAAPAFSCEIEDMAYQAQLGQYIQVTGATTCASGRLDYRLYDENDKFIISGFTYIQGYAFQIMEIATPPKSVNIKYAIAED